MKTLSAELAAIAEALQQSHRTGYTVPVVQIARLAEKAAALEQQAKEKADGDSR